LIWDTSLILSKLLNPNPHRITHIKRGQDLPARDNRRHRMLFEPAQKEASGSGIETDERKEYSKEKTDYKWTE